jgi:hypothetical protein
VKSVYPNFFFILKLASLHYLMVANTRVSRDLRVSRRCFCVVCCLCVSH